MLELITKSKGPSTNKALELMSQNIEKFNDKERTFRNILSYFQYLINCKKELNLDIFGEYDRLSFNFDNSYVSNDFKKCSYYNSIEKILKDNDYVLVDYIKGIASKNNRNFKIGKILTKLSKNYFLKGFMNSPYRSTSKHKMIATLSSNFYDVATMSTFKGWTSCMNLIDGEESDFIERDLNEGTLILYLHKELDAEIKNPSARILLKPYKSKDDEILYVSEGMIYGTTNIKLDKIAIDVCNLINKDIKASTITDFYPNENLYNDGGIDVYAYNPDPWDFYNKEHIDRFDVNNFSEDELRRILKDHKQKELFINKRSFRSFIEYDFEDDQFVKKLSKISNFISIFLEYLPCLSKASIKNFINNGIKISDHKKYFFYYYNGEKIFESDGIIEDPLFINLINLNLSNELKIVEISKEEIKILDNIETFNHNSQLSLSLAYQGYENITIHNLSYKQIEYLRDTFSKEEFISFLLKIEVNYINDKLEEIIEPYINSSVELEKKIGDLKYDY